MTSPESQGRKENTVNSKQQEELHTLRGRWKINLENITGVDIAYILDKSRKDYSRVVGTDGIGLARYQSECLAAFGIGTNLDVAESALDTAVEAVTEVFSSYPTGTVTRALGETVVENVTNKIESTFGISVPSVEVEVVESELMQGNLDRTGEGPANMPLSFLRRTSSVTTGIAVLLGGAFVGGVGSGWTSGSEGAWAAPVEGQSLTVTSSVAMGAERDGYSVTNSPAVQSAVASLGGAIPYIPISGAGNSALLASGMKYIGARWDCTALVEQALRDLGYEVGDLAPMQFGSYGTVFYDPAEVQAGDIMMRGGHVAIYAGDGMTLQGGYGFGGVVLNSWEGPSSYAAFVRVG